MSAWSRLRSFLDALTRRSRFERDVLAELEAHLGARVDDLMAHGLDAAEADRRARLELGDPVRWREEAREARGLRLLDELRADVVYGLRWLRRSPGFAASALLSLAFGIGANVAIFSLFNDVLLRSLPVDRPDQLVMLASLEGGPSPNHAFSYRALQFLRAHTTTLEGIAASSPLRVSVMRDGRLLPTASAQFVSGNYHALLGVPAVLGRVIGPSDDGAPGTGDVAVLDYAYWHEAFGGDPNIVGQRVILNGHAVSIVGVTAPEFFGTHVGERADISLPLSIQPVAAADFGVSLVSGPGANDTWLELIGRRRAGVTASQAEAETAGVFAQLVPEIVANAGPKMKSQNPRLVLEEGSRGLSELRQKFSLPLSVLMAVVGLVLVLACANLANLLLARAANRRHEVAVRASLGAGRARLVRQFLTESLILSLAGGILGLVLALSTATPLARLLSAGAPARFGRHLDIGLAAFTLGLSVLTTLLFGSLPAFSGAQVAASGALNQRSAPATSGATARWTRNALLALQTAISVVVLIAAGLFVRTLVNLGHVNFGFDRGSVLALRLEPAGSNQKHQNGQRLLPRYADLVSQVAALPGVVSASLSGTTPLSYENQFGIVAQISGYQPEPGEDMHIRMTQVFPDFLRTMGIPLLAGRDLTRADNDPAMLDDPAVRRAAVINQTMARRFFGSPQAALGRVIQTTNNLTIEIVGVAGDTHDRAVRDAADPLLYCTYAQASTGRGQMTLLVRVEGDPHPIVPSLRTIAMGLDPAMPLADVEQLSDRVSAATAQERMVAVLSSLFGVVSLLLVVVGLGGVTAYGVVRRRSEFGVRLALGATGGELQRSVITESLRFVLVGLVVGLLGAVAAGRAVSHLLYGIKAMDAPTFAAASTLLVGVAMLSAYIPARQVSRVDPTTALRE